MSVKRKLHLKKQLKRQGTCIFITYILSFVDCPVKYMNQIKLHVKDFKVCTTQTCYFSLNAYSCFPVLIHDSCRLPIFHLTAMKLPKEQSCLTPKANSTTQLQKHLTIHPLLHPIDDVYGEEGERCILKLTTPLKAYRR